MYVVVGLGNPGQRYAGTRHNVGFMVIERLAERWSVALAESGGVRMGRGEFSGTAIVLVEPRRYMNLSGEAVVDALPNLKRSMADTSAEGWGADEIIIVHDDIDLPCGQLRIKRGGGSGGHRGVASIAAQCGADSLRVRVGIGRPAAGGDAAGHVLEPFVADERHTIGTAIERAAEAVESLIRDGLEVTRNRFNRRAAITACTD